MEFDNVNRGHDLLDKPVDAEGRRLGRGPNRLSLVDACMRSVTETGYLNFRMRAMLVRFDPPPVATVAGGRPSPRAAIPRFRAGHPLPPVSDAGWGHRHQHGAHLQSRQAGGRP